MRLAAVRNRVARWIAGRALDAASPRPWTNRPAWSGIAREVAVGGAIAARRAHDLVANDPFACNGVEAWVSNAVGAGIVPVPRNRSLGAAWNAWIGAADADGRTDVYGLQAAMLRATAIDGEAFAHLEFAADGALRVRLIAAERVDWSLSRELGEGRRIVNGVEFDTSDRVVAYHVLQELGGPLALATGAARRVPAEDMIHVMRPLAPGQVRGLTWFAPVMVPLREYGQYLSAQLQLLKVGALVGGFVKTLDGAPGPFDGTQSGGQLDVSLEPG
ncbi:MAG: phage portal protein, partial [Alphaproteobacteria bacterium]|nr:phage portal protein [Alphaproteobacteria bacterium]